MAQVIKKRIVKAILWVLLSIFLLLAIVAGAIQVPYIQTKLVHYISEHYSELTGYDISIQRIAIDWFDEVHVEGVSVVDPEDNNLLYAEDVTIDFRLKAVLDKANHNIDNITIDKAEIFLTKITIDDSVTTLNINELIRRIKAQIRKQTKSRQYLSVDHVSLKNSSFTYYDQERDSIKTGFDYHHFSLAKINGEFDNLSSVADTLDLEVRKLTANETSTHLDIKHMTSSFRVSQSAMEFRGLDIKVGNSTVKDTIIFKYSSTLDFSDFNSKITIDAHLDNTRLHSKDLGLFAPALSKFDDYYQVSGDFTGKVSSLTINNAHLKFGEGTALRGKIRMTGLPDIEETFINFDLTNSYVRTTDLKNYIKEKTYTRLEPFGQISFNAEFLGFFNDFVANGDFFTDYGRIISDINLKLDEDVTQSTYSGKLYMQNFDMGGYSGNTHLGRVTVRGEIKGSGVTIEDADFELKGFIDKIGIKDYEYTNIQTDAHFAKEYFEGFIDINDPNLRLTATGSIDLREGVNLFNIKADLDTISLKPLNLSKEDLFISSEVVINARGLEIDSVVGIANLKNSLIRYRDNTLQIDSLSITSRKKSGERQLLLETNLFNFKAEGEFDYTVVYKDLKTLLYEYRLNLQNDKDALTSYYSNKDITNYADYSLDYTVDIKDPNPLFELIAPDLFISQGSTVSGNFTGGYTSIISMDTHLDTVVFKNDSFYNNELQLNISKIADSTSVLAMAYLASENQTIANVETRNMMFEGIWNNMHIDFEFDIDQVRYPNYARLFGAIDFLPDQTRIRIQPSDLQILDKKWEIQRNNLITIDGKEITVDDFKVYNESQSISLNGRISEDTENELVLNIDSLKLENLNTIFNKKLSGTINGFANLSSYYQSPQIQSDLSVTKFKIEEFLIGDVKGTNTWNNSEKQFEVNFIIERLKSKILQVKGTYTPDKEPNPLNLIAHLDKTELKILEPFIEHYFTKVDGTASGELSITGSPSEPIIRGDGFISEGAVHINYLRTNYKINGAFYFEENKLGFNSIKVTDSQGNTSAMAGVVTHNNFRDFYIDISGYLDNFLVLNTTSSDNNLFYGTGVASGSIHFLGPVNNMNIIAQAKTEKGTRIFIPVGDSENIEQEDYINFINFKDTTDAVDINEVSRVDLRGLKLDFDLNITPDAYCEIIFDIKSGDIIRGRGNGDIKLQIDTKGDFNMFGDFNIQEGGYNFTLYSIINKEFEILPGSKISWYGDPYQGILDINATYNQLATLLPLLIRQEADKVYEDVVEIKRKYPVKVFLDIDGPLLSPTVNFDIIANNLPRNIEVAERPPVDLEFEFLKFKNSIDEQELKRQVFSLIVLRRFSPLQSFNTGGSITSSVSELLSNQLSYWITQVDENLEIDFDVDFDKLDEEAYNTFQLRLSYTFLDGRLRVTRDGGFTNQENRTDVSSVAGDWTLEYILTPDGKFRAKMYNRTNYNPINPTKENQNTITTGFSITHTQSFNELKDLFKKRKKEKEDLEENEAEEEESEPDEDTPGNTQSKAALKDEEDETH